jgi:hypothetical protein
MQLIDITGWLFKSCLTECCSERAPTKPAGIPIPLMSGAGLFLNRRYGNTLPENRNDFSHKKQTGLIFAFHFLAFAMWVLYLECLEYEYLWRSRIPRTLRMSSLSQSGAFHAQGYPQYRQAFYLNQLAVAKAAERMPVYADDCR